MRRSMVRSIGDVLGDFIRENDFDYKMKSVEVVEYWYELMGKPFASYTRHISLSKGVLLVETTSPVVKSELIMNREDLRRRLNERAGEELVQKIVFR